MDNLAGLLTDAAQAHAERPALLVGDTHITHGELGEAAARWSGFYRERGVRPGDRVAIVLPNGLDYIGALYGALSAGAIAVPLNPLLRRTEIEDRVTNSDASILVAPAAAEELAGLPVALVDPSAALAATPVAGVVPRDPGEPAVLLYTSGTTGRPKGAELTHAGLRATAAYLAGPLLQLTKDDVLLGAAPFSHIFGLAGISTRRSCPALASRCCRASTRRRRSS